MKGFLLLLLVLSMLLTGFGQDAARQGYNAYQEGNFAEAESLFRQALESDPDNPRLLYNLGSTLAQQGDHEEAGEYLKQFREQSDEPSEQAQAEYNLGNVFSDQEDWENALRHYRNSLKINPQDEDARFNYELAYRKNQQEQQEQPPDEQPDQSPQDSDAADAPPELSDEDGQQMPGDLPEPGEQHEDQISDISDMSPEEADEMLNALDNIEQHLLRDFKERQMETVEQDEKDW